MYADGYNDCVSVVPAVDPAAEKSPALAMPEPNVAKKAGSARKRKDGPTNASVLEATASLSPRAKKAKTAARPAKAAPRKATKKSM